MLHRTPSIRFARRYLSTSGVVNNNSSAIKNHGRVTRILYRQLLRWCQTVERYDIHVLGNILPPAVVEAPDYIDAYRAELLAMVFQNQSNHDAGNDNDMTVVRKVAQLLPRSSKCERNRLQVELKSIQDLKRFVQAMFRINNVPIDTDESSDLRNDELNQKRRDIAFDKLRKLNELHKNRIYPLKDRHIRNADRRGVLYRVGEVVQHRNDRWRGVITAWERGGTAAVPVSDDFGSLTKKSYQNPIADTAGPLIRYSVVLDVGDAYQLTGASTLNATQPELEAVTDEHLTRIRNDRLLEAFTRFDATTHSFVANEILQYEFPSDQQEILVDPSSDMVDLCNEITTDVKSLAEKLEAVLWSAIKERAESSSSRLNDSTTTLWRILKRIASGEVYVEGEDPETLAPTTVAAMHLKSLLDVLSRILEAMSQRRLSLETKERLHYQVGDIVRHTKYGFRGVVVAWDPTPSVDVSNWDGVQDIENVMELPFYSIIPDKDDCIEAFGGERDLRYVCQANLEPCPSDQLLLNLDLGTGWQPPTSVEPRYIPPVGLSFAYGGSLHDEENDMEANMTLMEKTVNNVYVSAQQNAGSTGGLSLKNLARLLQCVDNLHDATVVQDAIKEIRKANVKLELRNRLNHGITSLVAGKPSKAMETFESIVAEDPEYAEAWNKLGTCRYVSNDHDGAAEAFEKVLALDETNSQALSSMGLISFDQNDYKAAADWFRKSLVLDPWGMSATRLSACIDLLAREK